MPLSFTSSLSVLSLIALVFVISKQVERYYKSRSKQSPHQDHEAAGSRRGSRYSVTEDGECPKPTPLMITPEQVANYDDRPWRPFRWPYHQTMSIFKLDINHWLDMDKYYVRYIEEKKRIFMEYGKENIDWLPEGYEGSLELMETVMEHMVERYPLLFTVLKDDQKGKIIKNEITGELLDMTLPLKEHPLIYVSKVAKEDFYVVKKNEEDGQHYLVAAAVPFPGGSFGIHEKLGKSLDVIHTDVPYYKEKLKTSMERWFGRMKASEPVERASWYITWDYNLRINNVYQLPKFVPNKYKSLDEVDTKDLVVRVERQTLRKLPKSGCVIFTNHPIFYTFDEMKDEPLIPSILLKIIYEGPSEIIKYKNFDQIRDSISKYLKSLVKRQIDLGIITEETPVKTLPTYPFAHWAKTDFDYVNGWTNPRKSNVKQEST